MFKHLFLASAVLSTGLCGSAAAAQDASGNQSASAAFDRAATQRELEDLRRRMEKLERSLNERPADQAGGQAASAAPQPPGNDNLELYGFVQFDGIQDFDRVNP